MYLEVQRQTKRGWVLFSIIGAVFYVLMTLMMNKVSNSFVDKVEFDVEGIPVNCNEDHGFGTRSIVAFCDKNDAYYRFTAKDNVFTLYLNFLY